MLRPTTDTVLIFISRWNKVFKIIKDDLKSVDNRITYKITQDLHTSFLGATAP